MQTAELRDGKKNCVATTQTNYSTIAKPGLNSPLPTPYSPFPTFPSLHVHSPVLIFFFTGQRSGQIYSLEFYFFFVLLIYLSICLSLLLSSSCYTRVMEFYFHSLVVSSSASLSQERTVEFAARSPEFIPVRKQKAKTAFRELLKPASQLLSKPYQLAK